jgi:hypothetical protein
MAELQMEIHMETNLIAAFAGAPAPTTFIVNVIHVHPGKQQEAFDIIQDVVHYVADRKEGFLWSSLAKSSDGQTVVNVEAIQGAGNVDEFFSDPVFVEKFRRLDTVSKSEFHTYTVGDLVLPRRATAV